MIKYLLLIGVFCLPLAALAADPDWQPVATELLQREKTGFGGLCGIVVDHERGDVWVNLSDRGTFHSADQGGTWKRVSETQPKGRTETPGCWLLDPTGKSRRMVTALVYGSPISISDDQGATWRSFDAKSSHVDWCAVDWTDPEQKFVLTLKHEAGDLLIASSDGGRSFREVGKNFGTAWVFDNQTAIAAQLKTADRPRANIARTTDGGKTWQPCSDSYRPFGSNVAQALPKWRSGRLYWLTEDGLIVTSDQGQSWQLLALVKGAQYGPIFGRDDKHLFVLTKSGVVESRDGGTVWSEPVAPPKEMKGIGNLSWLEYDPSRDVLYLMKMGSDLYRLNRAKP